MISKNLIRLKINILNEFFNIKTEVITYWINLCEYRFTN
jgi:hypothetical protein